MKRKNTEKPLSSKLRRYKMKSIRGEGGITV